MKERTFHKQGCLPRSEWSRDTCAARIRRWRAAGYKVARSGDKPHRVIYVADYRDKYLNSIYLGVEEIVIRQIENECSVA